MQSYSLLYSQHWQNIISRSDAFYCTISKAILAIVGQDVIDAAGPLQLCTGLDGGCEIAVHSIRHLFANSEIEAILLVDATNAFNSLVPN